MGFKQGSPKGQADQAAGDESQRLKIWCGRCWTYVDRPHHDCNNAHRPLKPEPKLTIY